MIKKIMCMLFSLSFLISGTGFVPVSAEETSGKAFCYENTFDNGIDSAVDFEDENVSVTVPTKSLMKTAELDGNKGITYINRTAWANQPSIRADFKNKISSGVLTVSFDFKPAEESVLATHTGDNHSFGMKMNANWDGVRIAYFRAADGKRIKYIPMTQVGDWDDGDSAFFMDDGLHSIVWTFDYTNGKLYHYLDGKLVKTQTNLAAFPASDFEIALGGQFAYFDNLRISYHPKDMVQKNIVYQNSYDNGIADRKTVTNKFGTMTYSGNVVESSYSGNTGFGMHSGSWANPESVKFTFKEAVTSGKVRISFDTLRSKIENPQYSYIKLDSKFVFYMTNANGFYGPNEALRGWGDTSATTPFEMDTLYHVELLYDFDALKAYTYINGELLSERSMPKEYSLTTIDIWLSMINSYFDELKIEKENQSPVEYRLSSEKIGNIFFEDDSIEISLNERNIGGVLIDDNPKISVKDADGNVVFSKNVLVKSNPGEEKNVSVNLGSLAYGPYTVTVTSEYGAEATMQLSHSVRSPEINDRVGVCTHMLRYAIDVPGVCEVLGNAGLCGLRIDLYLTTDDETLEKYDKVVDEAAKYGMQVLMILPTGDGTKDDDGGFNTTDEFLEKYYEICNYIANHFKGKVYAYEIGNEINYFKKSDGTPEVGQDYVPILKTAYDAIKAADKDALVSTAGTAIVYTDTTRNQRQIMTGMFETMQAAKDYPFDVFSTHPYHVAQPPETKDIWIENHSWPEQAALAKYFMNMYGAGDKLSWATEVGWASSGINETKAAYHVRMLALNDIAKYNDRTYIYDSVDHGYNKNDAEDCYGMIRNWNNEYWNSNTAYSAKPLYLAIAQYNKMTAGLEAEKQEITDDKYISWFKQNDKKLAVVWTTSSDEKEITVNNSESGKITVWDMYGNITAQSEGDSITVKASGMPHYVTFSEVEMNTGHNGEEITTLKNVKEGDTITFSTKAAQDEQFIVAAYGSDGRLLDVEKETTDINGIAECNLLYSGAVKYKMMLWDGFSSMKNLTEPTILE